MEEKNAIVTGAAKRLGAAIAKRLANLGWNIALHYNNSYDEAEKVAKEIRNIGRKAFLVKADLSVDSELNTIIEKANEGLGELSLLINNASAFNNDLIDNITRESWNNHIDTNLWAPLKLSQDFSRQLSYDKKGQIINMVDYCVLRMPNNFLSYSTSKAALWSLTQSLGLQLAPKIRVNAIGPGDTLKNPREKQEHFDKACASTPLKHGSSPEEVCDTIEYFLKSKSVTGQLITLDGGKHLLGGGFY
ncbi:SDR family oxidoreductase [Rickettsiales bacterium]|nr:SDR family oxidoreductase [Rickettsiales bacterium]